MSEQRDFEYEFLRLLAPIWLGARLQIMGGRAVGLPKPNVEFDMLGCLDYSWEMRTICTERRKSA